MNFNSIKAGEIYILRISGYPRFVYIDEIINQDENEAEVKGYYAIGCFASNTDDILHDKIVYDDELIIGVDDECEGIKMEYLSFQRIIKAVFKGIR